MLSAGALSSIDLELDLDVFHGPFDLLVTLILKEEIDIWEVRVSRIIAEYVLRLADSGEFDLEATSEFVVLVASLLEMKSRLLADGGGFDDDDAEIEPEEAGEHLLASLIRYGQFRQAAEGLGERWEHHSRNVYRVVPIPARYLHATESAARIDSARLADALTPLLREPPAPDVSHITDLAITLVQELRRLRSLLDAGASFTFASVAPRSRIEKAVTFFALLELHNRGEVVLRQSRPFADIMVSRAPACEPVALVG